jgi:hypothetical protein
LTLVGPSGLNAKYPAQSFSVVSVTAIEPDLRTRGGLERSVRTAAAEALGSEKAGREIEGPMAITILSGLLTSTALNLLVLLSLALRYGRFEGRRSRI